MPKKVMADLTRSITRDIASGYTAGDKYLTLTGICEKFSVSRQTAFNAIRLLVDQGVVTSSRGAGIVVTGRQGKARLEDKKIITLAKSIDDPRIHEAYHKGIASYAQSKGVQTDFVGYDDPDTKSLPFAEYMDTLDTDGIIALNFHMSALPFYRTMTRGTDIVAEIAIPDLPTLPVLQVDDEKHAAAMAYSLKEKSFSEVLLIMYGPPWEGNYWRRGVKARHDAIKAELEKQGIKVMSSNLSDTGDNYRADNFLQMFRQGCVAVSLESTANRPLAGKFLEHRVPADDGQLMIFTDYGPVFKYLRLPAIPVSAPSYEELGSLMAQKLIKKWETGEWTGSLSERV